MMKTIISVTVLAFCLCGAVLGVEVPLADYIDPVTGMEFVSIPGGTFVMGDNNDKSASPEHEVTVSPFLLSRYEVTFGQYATFCHSTGRELPADNGWGMANRPIINVSWHDAVAFTEWLSQKTGKMFRLPSEAEWEFAARGGSDSRFPWGNVIGENLGDEIGLNMANCRGCGSEWDYEKTAPVGSFPPNGYGLYDMIGNVYEWVLDLTHHSYNGAPTDGSAWLTGGVSSERVHRGGSWYQSTREQTIPRRCWRNADTRDHEIGFRVVLEK